MHLAQRHYIKRSNPLYQEADKLSFLSKNLYNCVVYQTRQRFFQGELSLGRSYWQHFFVETQSADYYALPSKAAQGVVHQVLREWKSYFAALTTYKTAPQKFQGRPRIPNYKEKLTGRNVLNFPSEAISKKLLRKGLVGVHKTTLAVKSELPLKLLRHVRIVPSGGGYWFEAVYDASDKQREQLANQNAVGIDLGVNNLATVVSNTHDFPPLIVNGKPLKSLNRQFNMLTAKEKSKWDLYRPKLQASNPEKDYPYVTRRMKRITHKRNMQVKNYLHHASTYIVKQLVFTGISTVVVGKNKAWKQATNLGRRNNQNFVQIPFAKFIHQLEYKCALAGITLLTTEESYTSKCSFLDGEKCEKKAVGTYLGKRTKRGLFRAASGQHINADVNGAANILTKVVPSAFAAEGIAGVLVRPRKITPSVICQPKVLVRPSRPN